MFLKYLLVSLSFCHSIKECTYSHFEQSSECPVCNKSLTENDFTELVVAEATSATSDIAKTSLQALFSKHSKSANGNKALQLSDLCYSLVRQIDVVKQSTKFLLKQLLMDGSTQNRRFQSVMRINEKLKYEITNIKQEQSSQRLQFEQITGELKNKLCARENKIQDLNNQLLEKDKMIRQFRQLHGGNHDDEGSCQRSRNDNNHLGLDTQQLGVLEQGSNYRNGMDPPMKGFMMQRQAKQQAQQKSFAQPRRLPNIPGINANHSNNSFGLPRRTESPMLARPYSPNSSGSNSLRPTPRIRELTPNTGYNFTGAPRMNKRRRNDTQISSVNKMSPSTSFSLNQGQHSVARGRQWLQRGSQDGSRR